MANIFNCFKQMMHIKVSARHYQRPDSLFDPECNALESLSHAESESGGYWALLWNGERFVGYRAYLVDGK